MYAPRWSPRLRQGDVIGPTFLPTIGKTFDSLVPARSLTGSTEEHLHKKVVIDGAYHRLAIISHCCEFNENKRNKFLVARLQTRPRHLSPEEIENLRRSNNPEARAREGMPVAGVDTFVLDPIPDHFDEEQVVAFTSITAVPTSMKDDLLGAKIAEFEQTARVDFREKLAWFFGRSAGDIPDEEKLEPFSQAGDEPVEGTGEDHVA